MTLDRLIARLEQIVNLASNVDPKNKVSRAFLESSIAELDDVIAKIKANGITSEQPA